MKVGDMVTFRNPTADEIGDVFRVLEDRGDRLLLEDASPTWDTWSIRPQTVYPTADMRVCVSRPEEFVNREEFERFVHDLATWLKVRT